MKITVLTEAIDQVEMDALIVPVFEDRKEARFGAASLFDSGEVTGKFLELTLLHHVPGISAARVLLAGAGKAEKFGPNELRKLAGAALRLLKGKSVRNIGLVLDPNCANAEYARAGAEGALLGEYEPDAYKTGGVKRAIETFALVSAHAAELDPGVRRGYIVGEAQNVVRALVSEPANRLTPAKMADAACEMASHRGLTCNILEREDMEKLGMGAVLGVAVGSAQPPKFIVIRYEPTTLGSKAHLGLVGKGVTFDSGGISIKNSDGMDKMKYDMAGGAAMIGAMQAIAELKPPIPVTAFVPCVENMPGGRAQRPGDIVSTMSGKTVEVVSTDAEGRLILADALTYARKQGCTHLVDVATLTGAIVVALGRCTVGLFSNDAGLRDRVVAASELEDERMWPMPLHEDYREFLNSTFADLGNFGSRSGGAITAAMFLKEFAEETPWVHLDIAGTAWVDDNKPFVSKGPTGLPVRTLVRLAMDWKD